MALLKQTFYRGLVGAGTLNAAVVPGHHYRLPAGPTPVTVAGWVKDGVLLELSGDPGPGFDCELITDKWFRPEPPPRPVEQPIERPELLKRLDKTSAELEIARARYGFPAPTSWIGGPSADAPDAVSRPRWMWSEIQRWLKENPFASKNARWGD